MASPSRPPTPQSTHSWWSDRNSIGPTISIHAAAKPLMRLMYHEQVRSFVRNNRDIPLSWATMEICFSYLTKYAEVAGSRQSSQRTRSATRRNQDADGLRKLRGKNTIGVVVCYAMFAAQAIALRTHVLSSSLLRPRLPSSFPASNNPRIMSFLLRLFRSEKPPDDESVLASLARDISRRQTLLADLRTRERTASALVTLYALGAWLAYGGVWYFGFVSGSGGSGSGGSGSRVKGAERFVRALPVFVGPIVILFIRRIVQVWYARKGDAEDKTLQVLLKAQRAKVEEIKKKTNFYETRELLSRYDSANGGNGSVSSPNTPVRGGKGPRPSTPPPPSHSAAPSPSGAPLQSQSTAHPPPPAPTHRRGWFDALADVLVGPDDAALSAAQKQAMDEKQKYALICEGCWKHCGLVPEGVWGGMQFTCPKCGHFNASPQSRGLVPASQSSASPLSPRSPASPLSPASLSSPALPLSSSMTMSSSPVMAGGRGAEGGNARGRVQASGASASGRHEGDVRSRPKAGAEQRRSAGAGAGAGDAEKEKQGEEEADMDVDA
ncbi:hypothetical protein DFH06DRAFT_100253 [Mycena polygramma]|nr:hypothetical protein DFH06DRAFT_100253 [Mycena polygramma]